MQRALLWIFAISLIGGVIMIVIELNTSTSPDSLGVAVSAEALKSVRWGKGYAESKVLITEFSDFQCPACGAYYPIVKKIAEDFGDRVRFSYRNFPLQELHKNALAASKASEAAGLQGKFWEMHDMIFENQAQWSDSSDADGIFNTYAGVIGLNIARFKSDFESASVSDKVSADYALGVSLGVNSTPTFFVNNIKLDRNPRSYEEFKSIIEKFLAENP